MQYHSPFNTTQEFLDVVFQAFANGAPSQHHLVFKSHPLDDGRVNLRKIVSELAAHHGAEDRVHFIYGGKLAKLLDHAKTAVTINSTAGQQALWRSIPLKTFAHRFMASQNLFRMLRFPNFLQIQISPTARPISCFVSFCFAHHNCPAEFILLQEGDSSCGH